MNGGRIGAGRTLERLFEVGTSAGQSDADLLERFAAVGVGDRAAEAAFEAIVERHGPMVLRVCRTVLRDAHAAEDAFQATFLVLARRARTLGRRERLGNWLYGVASRTARKARVSAARRTARDQAAAGLRPEWVVEPGPDDRGDEPVRILHEEIERLPGTYRAAVVACYLEGLTHEQAARRFQLAESTVRGRLARARKLLGNRLSRRGVAPAVGLVALEDIAGASVGPEGLALGPAVSLRVPGAIVRSVARDALQFARSTGPATRGAVTSMAHALAHGVLSTMWLPSFRAVATATAIAAVGIGLTAAAAGNVHRRTAGPEARAVPIIPATDSSPAIGTPPLPQDPREGRCKLARKEQGNAPKAVVSEDLAKRVAGTIVRSVPVKKDCMILAYLPDQNVGHVDNFALGNNGGGVRMLIDWADIPADEASSPENRLLLALYSRKTTSHPPTSRIHGFELLDDWRELNSWSQQPSYNPEPFATYAFEPGDGWKLFDITPMVRDQSKEGRASHGILLRFLSEDTRGPNWSGYEVVSREGAGEWAGRRPLLLIVKDAKAKADAGR